MLNMTSEEIRIAVAEACGWKWYRRPTAGVLVVNHYRALYNPLISKEYVETLQPADMTERQCNLVFLWREGMILDWPNDLNASMGLIERLRGEGWTCRLDNGLDGTWECNFNRGPSSNVYAPADTLPIAICTGFLLVEDKWKETTV